MLAAMTRSCALAMLALLVRPLPEAAHPQFALETVNRYTKLALLRHGQVRLLYTLMVGDVPALELRRHADRNGDGHLDAAEGTALAHELRDRVLAGLDLSVDGRKLVPAFDEPVLGLAGDAVMPSSFSVDLSAGVPVSNGDVHELRYEDRAGIPPEGEVEVLVAEGLGVKLLASYQGQLRPGPPETKIDKKTQFLFYGSPVSTLADRSVTLRIVEGQPKGRHRGMFRLCGLLVLVLLVGGWVSWRRLGRRRRARARATGAG